MITSKKGIAMPMIGPKTIKLAAGHICTPFASLIGGVFEKSPDIVFAYSPPLFMGLAGWLLKDNRKGILVLLCFKTRHLKP